MNFLISVTELGIYFFKLNVSLTYFANCFLRCSGASVSYGIFSSQSSLYVDGILEYLLCRLKPPFLNNSSHFCIRISTSPTVLLPDIKLSTYVSSDMFSVFYSSVNYGNVLESILKNKWGLCQPKH